MKRRTPEELDEWFIEAEKCLGDKPAGLSPADKARHEAELALKALSSKKVAAHLVDIMWREMLKETREESLLRLEAVRALLGSTEIYYPDFARPISLADKKKSYFYNALGVGELNGVEVMVIHEETHGMDMVYDPGLGRRLQPVEHHTYGVRADVPLSQIYQAKADLSQPLLDCVSAMRVAAREQHLISA
jgi:hypothetical protein